MKPFYILFRHKKPGKDVRFSIWKEYDDLKIWDSPQLEVVDYFETRKQAQRAKQKHALSLQAPKKALYP
tara:strand:- start:424 stop:630 length:207 start_codon:yes stop_codon:yes gene_type:complete